MAELLDKLKWLMWESGLKGKLFNIVWKKLIFRNVPDVKGKR